MNKNKVNILYSVSNDVRQNVRCKTIMVLHKIMNIDDFIYK